ncbi:hypothetical protein AB0C52_33195 [Streptomyces sp. NPDC048717]|uniref:hypothetical protein n=1 Tax=Streptomyces sp. NPDC048717 TaxID=3154928 RepID=UPI003437D653
MTLHPLDRAATAECLASDVRADLLLVPPALGKAALAWPAHHRSDPIGTVVRLTADGPYGFFLPQGSDRPAWPDCCTYLHGGTPLKLPPLSHDGAAGQPGWLHHRADGRLYSAPLVLHPIISALAEHPLGQGPVTTCR